jgi:hypothetical protein
VHYDVLVKSTEKSSNMGGKAETAF